MRRRDPLRAQRVVGLELSLADNLQGALSLQVGTNSQPIDLNFRPYGARHISVRIFG